MIKNLLLITLFFVISSGIIFFFNRVLSNKNPEFLYKIITQDTWEKSADQEHLVLPVFDDAFIHFATQQQAPRIIKKFFKDENDILILKINVYQLPGRLVFEQNPGGQAKYYHLYDGSIPKTSIVHIARDLSEFN